MSWLGEETNSDDIAIVQTTVETAYQPANTLTAPPTLLQKISFMMSFKGVAVKEDQRIEKLNKNDKQ